MIPGDPALPSLRGPGRADLQQGAPLLAGRLAGALFGATWLVVAARSVGAAGFGTVAVLIGLGTILGVLGELGIPLLVAEAVSRDRAAARDVVHGGLRLRIPSAIFGALVLVVVGLALDGSNGGLAGALYGVSLIASAVQTTLGSALRGLGRAGAEGAGELAVRTLTLACGVLALRISATGVSVMLAYAAGTSIASAGLWIKWGRALPGRGDRWIVHTSRAAGLGGAAALVTLYNRLDVLLLAWIGSERDAGVYAAAYRFFEGLLLPAGVIGAVLVPAAVAAGAGEVPRVIRRFVGGALVLTAGGALVVVAFARPLLVTLLGEEYGEAATALRLLALAAIPSAAFTAVSPVASLGHRAAGVPYLLVGLVANAALNLILIERLGAVGCGWAMLVSQTLMAVFFVGLGLRYRSPDPPAA